MKEEKPMLNIGVYSVISQCILDPKEKKYLFSSVNCSTHKFVHDIFRLRKYGYDFGDFFTIYSDGEEIVGSIRPSYDEFINFLSKALNTHLDSVIDDDNFEEVCRERIQVLSQIKSVDGLQREFPIIYQDFIHGREYKRILESQKDGMTLEEYKEKSNYYFSSALKYTLENFIPIQVTLYKRFLDRRREYLERIQRVSANRFLSEHIDMNKLTMLVVLKYIELCEDSDDYSFISDYLPFIQKYISATDIDYSCSVYDKKRHLVDIEEIVSRYYRLVSKVKNRYLVDTEEIVSRYYRSVSKVKNRDIIVNWELVPEGAELFPLVREERPRKLSMSSSEIDRLRDLGEKKTRYYEESGYYVRVLGKMKYKGYIAYIYPNGEVILDREYNSNSVSTASGNAIYHMKLSDFLILGRENKTTLQKDPRVERIIHSKKWMERINKIIQREGSEEELEEVRQFVKNIK